MKPPLSYDALRQVVLEQQNEIKFFRNLPLVERDKGRELSEVINRNWIKVVMGIRRCGKSILCHQALKDRRYGYLNFDDERLVGLAASDLNKMLQFLLEIEANLEILFFDEIQNVEGWELFVNRLQRQGYNILITGSNSKLLSKELATHLTGRYVAIDLAPFSFQEFLRAKQISWSPEHFHRTADMATLISSLEEYSRIGGFPDMVLDGYNGSYLRELYDKIVSRDITYRYHVKFSTTLKEIALHGHANLGCRISFNKVKNLFEINSIHTVKNYFQYLTDAYLICLLNSFSFKPKEKIKQPKKVYTIDNGLSASINPNFIQDRGALLENLVFQELRRQGNDFGYYSSPDYEIDFVLHKDKKVGALIQAAYHLDEDETKKREIKALLKGSEQLHCKKLMIITWDREGVEEIEGRQIEIIPIWKWLLMDTNTNPSK